MKSAFFQRTLSIRCLAWNNKYSKTLFDKILENDGVCGNSSGFSVTHYLKVSSGMGEIDKIKGSTAVTSFGGGISKQRV